MRVQTTLRPCPLTTLPAGNIFLLKIWVNNKRYTFPQASRNTVGPEHVFNVHTLDFKCRTILAYNWHA